MATTTKKKTTKTAGKSTTTKKSSNRSKTTANKSNEVDFVEVAKKTVAGAKKHKKVALTIFVVLMVVVIVSIALYFTVDPVRNFANSFYKKYFSNEDIHSHTYGDDELSFHFLELGNNYTGDCTYIKAGNIDILIDAGSRQNSAPTIESYVDSYCTDGKLEYVIATHAHQDHIAGFVSTKSSKGIFEYYECDTIIDFALTNSTSAIYNNYVTARDAEVASGASHYTALECYNNEDGAQQVYNLTENITMTILYQKYYEENTGDENNYSVCLLFTHGDKNFLLTGDLEKEGEESLVEENRLPKVELFKAGHHGSYTASNTALLSVIQPKIVCVCCCAGAVEYTQTQDNTFPSQAFIDRIAPYTSQVYVTTVGEVAYNDTKGKYEDTGFKSLNGNIVVKCVGGNITVNCSVSNLPLKDTEWFADNRRRPDVWRN